MQGELPPWFNDQCLSILPAMFLEAPQELGTL